MLTFRSRLISRSDEARVLFVSIRFHAHGATITVLVVIVILCHCTGQSRPATPELDRRRRRAMPQFVKNDIISLVSAAPRHDLAESVGPDLQLGELLGADGGW